MQGRTMRTVVSIILLLGILHVAVGFMCYSRGVGSDYTGVTFCPSTSCFSVGGSFLDMAEVKKGCADKTYPDGCPAIDLGVFSQHTCFCNSFLCNPSSMPSIFMPLLILPYLLLRFL
ncbi:uncharacterized protein [Panulirus ornatus]|uniref:uncharacterized protein isoform X1 n=2 Tax=Panulirus ornatus TaxID=150431 RepID=UPI003A84ADF7